MKEPQLSLTGEQAFDNSLSRLSPNKLLSTEIDLGLEESCQKFLHWERCA